MLNLIKFSQYFRGGGKLVTRGGGIPGLPPPLNETLTCILLFVNMVVEPHIHVYIYSIDSGHSNQPCTYTYSVYV